MIRVAIGDDHGIVREGIRRVLETQQDIEVCCEAANGREMMELLEDGKPDAVVLDISMPRMGGLETLEHIRARYPDTKVILLSVHGDAPLVRSAVSLGADGYLLKGGSANDVVAAVRAVMRGGSYFSPPVAREIVQQMRSPDGAGTDPFELLSSREREVLRHTAEGLSAKEIASELGISTKTVEAHRTSIMRKLGARKATELVRYAVRHGLIEP